MGGRVRVEHEFGARNAGGHLFEHLQPLPHHLEIDEHEASDVPARMRQARNEALLDGIVDRRHHDRNEACRLPQCPDNWRRLANEYVWHKRHEFCCVGPYAADVGSTKACFDLVVAAVLQPNSCRPCLSAVTRARPSRSSPTPISSPMRRTRSPCCARAASGHAAAPPSSVINWRRLRSSMGSPPGSRAASTGK